MQKDTTKTSQHTERTNNKKQSNTKTTADGDKGNTKAKRLGRRCRPVDGLPPA